MPNFLKKIFKPPSRHGRKAGPLPFDVQFSPTRTENDDIDRLATLLRDSLGRDAPANPARLLEVLDRHEGEETDAMAKLRQALVDLQDGRVSPFASGARSSRGGGRSVSSFGESGAWGKAIEACATSLKRAEKLLKTDAGKQTGNARLLNRIVVLMEAQRDELYDLRTYAEGSRLPTLRTLGEIYAKVQAGLKDAKKLTPDEAEDTLITLLQVLQEGPDYLIDVTIIEAIIWQAEVIDPGFGAEVRQILDRAVAEQGDLTTFRHAAESIIAVSAALPRDQLDDSEGINAYKIIGVLLKQLQARVASSRAPTPASSRRPSLTPLRNSTIQSTPVIGPSRTGTAPPSPMLSAVPSATSSRSATPDPDFQTLNNASDLQAAYGTGPMATPSRGASTSATPQAASTPKPPPSPSEADTEEGPEVWEYRGNLLTRSALSLVLRQEALALADSSGQYAGEVSWDDVRQAWIPKWAVKMQEEDVVEGEIPSTNPAHFVIKKKDAWGNKIGWSDGQMYYEEEPKFEV